MYYCARLDFWPVFILPSNSLLPCRDSWISVLRDTTLGVSQPALLAIPGFASLARSSVSGTASGGSHRGSGVAAARVSPVVAPAIVAGLGGVGGAGGAGLPSEAGVVCVSDLLSQSVTHCGYLDQLDNDMWVRLFWSLGRDNTLRAYASHVAAFKEDLQHQQQQQHHHHQQQQQQQQQQHHVRGPGSGSTISIATVTREALAAGNRFLGTSEVGGNTGSISYTSGSGPGGSSGYVAAASGSGGSSASGPQLRGAGARVPVSGAQVSMVPRDAYERSCVFMVQLDSGAELIFAADDPPAYNSWLRALTSA